MSLFLLELLLGVLDIRGHIPRFEHDPPRIERSMTTNGRAMARVIAAFLATALFLAGALWIALWLMLKPL